MPSTLFIPDTEQLKLVSKPFHYRAAVNLKPINSDKKNK
jgi:hypothetical protein